MDEKRTVYSGASDRLKRVGGERGGGLGGGEGHSKSVGGGGGDGLGEGGGGGGGGLGGGGGEGEGGGGRVAGSGRGAGGEGGFSGAGCGPPQVDASNGGKVGRQQAPWLTSMMDTFPSGLEALISGLRLEVSPLVLQFTPVEGGTHLCGMRFGFGMIVEGADGVVVLEGALPLCVKEVPTTFDHLDFV